ncbi:MAG: Nramp family divalent metal transporter [Hyphomonas sp.]|nr:Nramp family divalent metal transporter [Hyphomonas sp.]MCB9971589.1 Nramp family divalent metal transporter [Hyphomonas sp.]
MKLPFGPGALVAAAFIGPGTVTACTLAGAKYGYALVWALVFATFATIILQEMTVRLGLVGRKGLGEALVSDGVSPVMKWASVALVMTALALGNAAYEAGNLSGGALGLRAIAGTGEGAQRMMVGVIAVLAAVMLYFGRYKVLERILIALVLLMSLAFAASLLLVRPDWGALLSGLRPRLPEGSLLTAIGLIGTTIVPYNLFLHAATVRQRWPAAGKAELREAFLDTRLSVGLGGLISILILCTTAATLFGSGIAITSAADMASSLEPTYGPAARLLVGTGLCAAGLSSAITAPMATAYAVCEVTGRQHGGAAFKGVAMVILAIGSVVALSGIRPVTIILIAQVANGLLLPVVAVFLLITMNRKAILDGETNGPVQNALGVSVVAVAILLGARLVLRALGMW